jgi:hypothetical protein
MPSVHVLLVSQDEAFTCETAEMPWAVTQDSNPGNVLSAQHFVRLD